jgi:hypothetical protein
MSLKIPSLIVALLGGAFALAAVQPPSPITAETAFTFYQKFERITKVPRLVSPAIATLCITPTPDRIAAIKEATGPHHEARVHFYANAEAAALRSKATDPFPVGAIIVKEKLGLDDSAIALGGMRKQAPGFDPQNGDWEYFYATRRGEFTSGKLANCIACHARAKETDRVFSFRTRIRRN